ncbi:hypothetical protein ACAG39_10300 [Caldicellulosiruptoraceae bacterium PP1]
MKFPAQTASIALNRVANASPASLIAAVGIFTLVALTQIWQSTLNSNNNQTSN